MVGRRLNFPTSQRGSINELVIGSLIGPAVLVYTKWIRSLFAKRTFFIFWNGSLAPR